MSSKKFWSFKDFNLTKYREVLVKHSLLDLHGKTRHSGWKINRGSGSCTCSSCSEENLSHQCCLTLTPNNSKMIKRMTCHYFLQPIRRYVSHFSNRAALVLTIPLGKLQKIWLWVAAMPFSILFSLLSWLGYTLQRVVLSARILNFESNFKVLFLCKRFPPG